jgi:CRP-like cAMP-binding protein
LRELANPEHPAARACCRTAENLICINTRRRLGKIIKVVDSFQHPASGTSSAAPRVRRLLRELPLFEELGPTTLERLAASAIQVDTPSRTVIFERDDACRGLYAVITGQVKLALQGAQGAERVVELVGPGGVFGEIAVLNGRHLLTAETLVDTRLLQFAKATVVAELECAPDFTRAIVAMLSRRFQHLLGALEDCTLRSGVQRVTSYLLNRLPVNPVNGHAVVTLPAKKGVIASQLNLTHEHFSRLLHEVEAAGLIQVNGRDILIPDIGKLRAYPA